VGLAALTALCSCAVSGVFVRPELSAPSVPLAAGDSIDTRLLLVGDAGLPQLDSPEPVFVALAAEAAQLPERTWVVFLGDNIYPDGLPPGNDAGRALAEQRLRAQIDAVASTGARAVFVPGNHDWHAGGWEQLQRQRHYIESLHDPRITALPAASCPGPEVVDAGGRARLVFLDSNWWLTDGPRPLDPNSECPHDSESEIVSALQDAIGTAGERRVIVMDHHPLVTHGEHGGAFTWRQHIFPLVDANRWAWVPLPGLGSLYPLARMHGITSQDLSDEKYERMQDAFRRAFATRPPLLFASGHEHSLQVLDAPALGIQLVSGAGTVARPDHVRQKDDTLVATSSAGFARLDLLTDGRARLEIVTVSKAGQVTHPAALWLPRTAGR